VSVSTEATSTEIGASSGGRAARDIAAALALRVANLGLGIFVTLLLIRTLGDVRFGQWSTLFAVGMIAGYFGSMGLERVAVERAAADPAHEREWLGALQTLRLTLSIPAGLLALAVLLVISHDATMRTAAAFASVVVIGSALSSVSVAFELRARNRVVVAIELLNGLAWAGVVVLVALGGGGLVALAIGFAVVSIATNLLEAGLAVRVAGISLRGARRRWGPLLRRGVPVGIGGLLILAYGYIDQVLVYELAGARDAGLYGAVYKVLERVQFIPATVLVTLFPILVAARDVDPARVDRVIQSAVDFLLISALPPLAITLAGAEPLAVLLFGEEFRAAAPAFPILMGAFVLISIGYLAGYLVIAYELQRRFVVFAAVALVVNVAGNLLLVPRYGFVAAAWMTLLTELLVTGLSVRAVLQRMGRRPTLRRAPLLVGAAGILFLVSLLLREAGLPIVVWIAGGLLAYLATLFATRALTVAELKSLARREPPESG
jgi:O-antigen/teichoic acid export membrane protein